MTKMFPSGKGDSIATRITSLVVGLLLSGGFCQTGSAADSELGLYYGVQFAQFTYELDGVPDLEPTALVFRLGNMFTENFGIEGRLGGGIAKDDTDFEFLNRGANFEIEIENLAGIYGVARAPLSETASIYGLLGFTSISSNSAIDSPFISASGSDDDSSLSFGIGADWGPSDKFRISLEYMSYLDEDDFDASAISLGVQF